MRSLSLSTIICHGRFRKSSGCFHVREKGIGKFFKSDFITSSRSTGFDLVFKARLQIYPLLFVRALQTI